MISDPLKVLGDHQHVNAEFTLFFINISGTQHADQFLFYLSEKLIDHIVILNHLFCDVQITLYIGIDALGLSLIHI